MSEPQMILEGESTLDNLGGRSNKATPDTMLTSSPWLSVLHLCAWFALFSNFFFSSHSLWYTPQIAVRRHSVHTKHIFKTIIVSSRDTTYEMTKYYQPSSAACSFKVF